MINWTKGEVKIIKKEIGEQKSEREREKKWSKKDIMHSLWMKRMLKNGMMMACGIKKHKQCILVNWWLTFLMKSS